MKNIPRSILHGLCLAMLMPLLHAPAADAPPAQTANQTINLVFPVEGLAYAKVNVSPTPLNVTPEPPEGNSTPSVRNPTAPVTYKLTFPPNTNVTISINQFTGSDPGSRIALATVDSTGAAVTSSSITTLAANNSTWNVTVTSVEATAKAGNPPANWIADPYVAPAPPPVKGDFRIVGPPTKGAMITDTRRPTLKWTESPGAVKYDVYLNVSRTDYDWTKPGTLLDRYTLVDTVKSGTTYALQQDLPDRWTYKWYVVATDKAGKTSRSDIGTFSIYIPVLTKFDDGVPIVNGCRDLNKDGTIEPYEDWHNPPEVRVADLMSRMTLHEKAMQLFFQTQTFPEAGFGFGPFSLEDLPKYQLAAAKSRLGIPSVVIGDTIHGYKTIYPTQPGLAATRDLQIIWAVGDMQRRESLPVGERGSLSPLSEVGTKVLYPRIQEGCGEDADFAAAMLRAIVCGMQGGPEVNPHSMMITVKHWASQGGGGEAGVVYDGTTVWYHMRPWHAAIEAGASAIMPGYSGSWLLATEGHGAGDDPGILNFLRTKMGYQGVICTDWLGSGDWIRACTNGSDVMGGANAGQMGDFEKRVPISRIDDSVRRVLDLKFRMGIFEDPYGEGVNGAAEWHTPQNIAIARKAASESLTLLKNDGPLPIRLPQGGAIVVDGPRADDPRCMATWRSDFHENDFGCKTFFRAIALRAADAGVTVYGPMARKDWKDAPSNVKWAVPDGAKIDAAIVVVGETYYTHGTFWDKNSPYLPDDPIGAPHDGKDGPQFALIQKYHDQHIPVIVISTLPRPYVLTNVNKIADALMVVYRAGDEGGTAVAQMLWGDTVPSGKLSWQLPLSMEQVGTDDTAHWQDQPEKWDLPYDLGATPEERAQIRAAIAAGKHIEPIYGKPLYQAGSGLQGFGLADSTPPVPFKLISPTDGQIVTGALPNFKWHLSSDPESAIQRYELYVDDKLVATIPGNPGQQSVDEMEVKQLHLSLGNGKHSWSVKAFNWANGVTTSATSTFTLNDTTPPAAFQTFLPANNATVAGADPVDFHWEQTADEGTGLTKYEFLLDGKTAATVEPSPHVSPTTNLALGKNAFASSTADGTPGGAVDGDSKTRWGSRWNGVDNPDAAWLTVDLGEVFSIKEVTINWESMAKQYLIQVSDDNAHWTTIYTKTGDPARQEDLKDLNGAGRYVRMQGVQRSGGYGYSIWEFAVFGSGLEHATIPVPAGKHTWQVRAIDGAGNAAMNANGAQTIVR